VTPAFSSPTLPTLDVTTSPSSLAVGQLAVERDPDDVVAVWLGYPSGPVKILDAVPIIVHGTGAQRGTTPSPTMPPDALFVVTDSATVPAGMYQNQGGAWVAINLSGAQSKVKEWRIPGTATVSGTDWFWSPPTNGSILSLSATAQTAPNGQPLKVDLRRNGTSVDSVNIATVPKDGTVGNLFVPSSAAFVIGDRLQPVITQVGVQPPASPQVVTAQSASASGASYSVARMAAAQAGDLQIEYFYINPYSTTLTVPAGWTLLNSGGTTVAGTSGGSIWIAYRLHDSTTGPWTFTASATPASQSRVEWLITNVNQSQPIDASAFNYNSTFDTNPNLATLTTGSANALELLFIRPSVSTAFNPGMDTAGYTYVFGGPAGSAATTHQGYQTRATAGVAAPGTITGGSSFTSANARIAIRSAGTVTSWSPGVDVTLTMRYQET
jgi:hypothetical protein